MPTNQRGERPAPATSNSQLPHDQARRNIGAKKGKKIMETAKERFLRAISRPGDRTCWPPQRSMKWIMGGFMISQIAGLQNLIVIYTYLLTNQKNTLYYLFAPAGLIIDLILVLGLVWIRYALATTKIVFISIFFVYDIIISINFLVGWFYTIYLFIISFSATSGRAFNVAGSTFMYALLGLFFFWIVPVSLYFLVTTPWWQPWAKKEQWYNPDDDKAAHPDRR
jgi:hypothetical protein